MKLYKLNDNFIIGYFRNGSNLIGVNIKNGYIFRCYSDRWRRHNFKRTSGNFEIEIDDENYFYDVDNKILYIKYDHHPGKISFSTIDFKNIKINKHLINIDDINKLPKNKGFILKLKFNNIDV